MKRRKEVVLMSRIKLFKHQQEILDKTKEKTKVAYFLDM